MNELIATLIRQGMDPVRAQDLARYLHGQAPAGQARAQDYPAPAQDYPAQPSAQGVQPTSADLARGSQASNTRYAAQWANNPSDYYTKMMHRNDPAAAMVGKPSPSPSPSNPSDYYTGVTDTMRRTDPSSGVSESTRQAAELAYQMMVARGVPSATGVVKTKRGK